MSDDEIVPLLQDLRRATLFTRDADFCEPNLCHAKYCLAYLAVERLETALFARRLLRHPDFKTLASRLGKVIRVSHGGISFWQRNQTREQRRDWR